MRMGFHLRSFSRKPESIRAFWGGRRGVCRCVVQAAQAGTGLVGGEGGIQEGGGDAAGGELIDLIFHQRDERGDDNSEAFAEDSGELKAERFAAACGEEREGVAVGENVGDDFVLVRAEGGVAKVFFERGEEFGGWGGAGHLAGIL